MAQKLTSPNTQSGPLAKRLRRRRPSGTRAEGGGYRAGQAREARGGRAAQQAEDQDSTAPEAIAEEAGRKLHEHVRVEERGGEQAGARVRQLELGDDRRQQRREPDADDEVRRPREDEQEPHDDVVGDGRHAVGSLSRRSSQVFKYSRSLSGKFTVIPSAPACTTRRICSSSVTPQARTTNPSAWRRCTSSTVTPLARGRDWGRPSAWPCALATS